MIDKIDIFSNQPLYEPGTSKQQDIRKVSAQINMDASVHFDNAPLLDSAMQNTQTDPNLVAQAREALLSGKLDSFDNILQAAENIAKFGV